MFKLKSSTLTSMFTSFGNTKQSQLDREASDRTPPTTPASLSKDSKSSKMMDHSHSCNSFLSPTSPESGGNRVRSGSLNQSPLKGEEDDTACQSTENLLDRSVKISYPKKGDASGNIMTEAALRKRLVRFGQIMNVGMKEKVAAVLFATSTQALIFCAFHENCVGPDYKIKYMGTKMINDAELQELWQEQQQKNGQAGGSDKSSTSIKASTKFSKSVDSLLPSPSPRLPTVGDGGTASETMLYTDSYAADRIDLRSPSNSRFHCGSETESENDLEYGAGAGAVPRYYQGGGLRDNGHSTEASSGVCTAPQSPEKWKSETPWTDKPACGPLVGAEIKTKERPPGHSKNIENERGAIFESAHLDEEGKNPGRGRLQIDDCNDYEEGLRISHSTEHKELATPRWHGAAKALFEGPSLLPESSDATGSMRSSRYDRRSSVCDSPNYISNDEEAQDEKSLLRPSRSKGGAGSSSSSKHQTTNSRRRTEGSTGDERTFSTDFDASRSGIGSGPSRQAQVQVVQAGRQSPQTHSPYEDGYSGGRRQPLVQHVGEDERRGRGFNRSSADISFDASRLPLPSNTISGMMIREDRQTLGHSSIALTERDDYIDYRDREYNSSILRMTHIEAMEAPTDNRGIMRTEANVRRSYENRNTGRKRISASWQPHASTDSSKLMDTEELYSKEHSAEDLVHLRHILDTVRAKNRVLEKESDLARKRVQHLESEALVKQKEREEALVTLAARQDQWTAELTAHIHRNTALEQELRNFKEELEGAKIKRTADEAKIKSLTETLLNAKPDLCGLRKSKFDDSNKAHGDDERKEVDMNDAKGDQFVAVPLQRRFPINTRSQGATITSPPHFESKVLDLYGSKQVNAKELSTASVRPPFEVTARPAFSPATPTVTFASRAEVHSRSVSEGLLQDLKTTRRQIDALNRMAYSFDASCKSNDIEFQGAKDKEISSAEGQYRPHNTRGEEGRTFIGQQSTKDWSSLEFTGQAALPLKTSPSAFRPTHVASHFTPITRCAPTGVHATPSKSPCPSTLMSYYSHLLPARDLKALPSSPGSSVKANRRRAYLARLLDD